jgi:hypothetical protein
MKRFCVFTGLLALVLALACPAFATVYTFEFSEEDLWNHTASADSRLYNQDAPRRHHVVWKGDVATTDTTQPYQNTYKNIATTDGWYQTTNYDAWLAAGPKDNAGNDYRIAEFNFWGANYPNSKMAWGEKFSVNSGAAAWTVLQVPTGWSAVISENPWPDPSKPAPQYFPEFTANNYTDGILYSKFGDGVKDYVFKFQVDIIGAYPTINDPNPTSAFETDGSLRLWFGGKKDTSEGFDGVMKLNPVPIPGALVLLGAGLVRLARYGRRKKALI